jgi:CxxC motif-containing protein
MIKEIICDRCDKRCILSIDKFDNNIEISGNQCGYGINYAQSEGNISKDIFTTLVRIKGSRYNVVSVKSTKPLEKKIWIECSKALGRLYVGAPIKIGDIICKNILNTGANIICTKNIEKNIE